MVVLAPFSINNYTISKYPKLEAHIRAVIPLSVTASISAPASKRVKIFSLKGYFTAAIRGVIF
jgi:hypothetical protein